MLIWSCDLNLRPKSPRGDQSKPIFNSWEVDLVLLEPEDEHYTELKNKVNEQKINIRNNHFGVWRSELYNTPEMQELKEYMANGAGEQKFTVKHLHPFWNGYQGYDDYEQLVSLAETVWLFNTSSIKSDDSLAFAPLIDVAQLVRIINVGSILGGQTFNVDPERYIPVVDYDDDDETRYHLVDTVQRKSVGVRHSLGQIYGLKAVGYPEPDNFFSEWATGIDELETQEQKDRDILDAQDTRLTNIKEDITSGVETDLEGPLGKPDIDKLKQLSWGYSGSYHQDKYSELKYFLTDVNSNLSSRFETKHLISNRQRNDEYGSPLADESFDFGAADLSNTYYKIKGRTVRQLVDHFDKDQNGKTKKTTTLDTISFVSQEYSLTAFMNEVKNYVNELKG